VTDQKNERDGPARVPASRDGLRQVVDQTLKPRGERGFVEGEPIQRSIGPGPHRQRHPRGRSPREPKDLPSVENARIAQAEGSRTRSWDRTSPEDVTSQVFERALRSIERFEWRGVPLSAWLFRSASNALADHWRERARDAHEAGPETDSRCDRIRGATWRDRNVDKAWGGLQRGASYK
jgi:hypothetical protein